MSDTSPKDAVKAVIDLEVEDWGVYLDGCCQAISGSEDHARYRAEDCPTSVIKPHSYTAASVELAISQVRKQAYEKAISAVRDNAYFKIGENSPHKQLVADALDAIRKLAEE